MPSTVDHASETYLNRWNRLVSTTNWEKGRIIFEWRAELLASETPAVEISDEAWSRRVGSVSPQHVGRLRRVWERFGESRETYAGLFWSHFQAALDWHDPELWLEGAVQNGWSISEMRSQRATMHGLVDEAGETPPAAEWDEDSASGAEMTTRVAEEAIAPVRDANDEHDTSESDRTVYDDGDEEHAEKYDDREPAHAAPREASQPFAQLPSLPADVTEAFEAFKLCVIRRRLAGWSDISRDDLIASLDALKELALAPAE